jgi:acetolactate synthase small subunit
MKKQAKHNNQMIFCIYAADRKGLLGLLLIHFNRRYYDVNSLNVSRTDVSDMIMVTIEAAVPADKATILAEKLKKIIGVYSVVVYPSSTELKKAGFYRLSAEAQNNSFLAHYPKARCKTELYGRGLHDRAKDRERR